MSTASSKFIAAEYAGRWTLLELLIILLLLWTSSIYRGWFAGAGDAGLALGFAVATFLVAHSILVIRRRVWDPWFSLTATVGIFLIAQTIVATVISSYGLVDGIKVADLNNWLNSNIGAQFLYILFTETLTVSAIYGYLKLFRIPLAAIGVKRPRLTDPLFGLAALPVYFILYLVTLGIITHFVPGLNINQKQQLGFNSVHGPLQMTLTFVSLVVLPPLAEEVMVRGFLYSSLKRMMPTTGAVIITSAIFASAHLPEGGSAGPLYIAAIDTFTLSLVLIWLREKTGSLWAGITLHALKNGIAFLALFVLASR